MTPTEKAKILLLTGSAGEAQGWGDAAVTAAIAAAGRRSGHAVTVAECETPRDVAVACDRVRPRLVWSSLYAFSKRSDINAFDNDSVWVADLLEAARIPFVGPPAAALRLLLGKFSTHEALADAGLAAPRHWLWKLDGAAPECVFPVMVKPDGESRSAGIYDDSVAANRAELERCCRRIHREFSQNALIEEFLPGVELTVLVLGDGERREILPGIVTVADEYYGPYRVLRGDLRGVGLTGISAPGKWEAEASSLAAAAAAALGCRDHVRIDMREDATGRLRIMEVNGIPGLKPGKSWSPQLYSLFHPEYPGTVAFDRLVSAIIASALRRGFTV